MSSPIHIKEDCDLLKLLKNNEGVSVVMFTADWCNPCRRIKAEINSTFYKEAQFYYVDIDYCEKLSKKYKIEGVPNFKFFVSGEKDLMNGFSGADSSKLNDTIEKLKKKVKEKEKKKKKEEKFSASDFP